MKLQAIFLLAAFGSSEVLAEGAGFKVPNCVSKCWENSKFITACPDEIKCLCEDVEFQAAFHQCLYSQCQTAQFGSALHTALMRCSEYDVDGSISSHFLRQDLRKRDAPDAQYISGLGQPSAVYSVHRRGSVSASAYARPTMAERADYGPYGGMDQATTTAAPSSLISQYEYGTSEPVLNPAVRH